MPPETQAKTPASISSLIERWQSVQLQVADAAKKCNRDTSLVRILAVSKTKPASAIAELYQLGQRAFGENYVQEGVDKIHQLQHLSDIEWHFIGPLQSNKTKDVAEHFAWCQSIDRDKIARRLNDQRPHHLPPLQVLIQVNIDDESSKSGIALRDLDALAEFVSQQSNLNLRGIMAIPKANASAEEQQQSYAQLQLAFMQLQAQYPSVDTLSLGMSSDLAAAIAHGSTMVRIGTALFGARQ